ncbi:diguanylate cyclase (GGDEF) domain-containing protein [Dialister histaminiformans]|uniref:Diguanylate cyclase (GGDEF) domain-containing protein n=1 Tax=Allisonella histaminiformans TaxID=209880 RepID=A0A1G5W7Y2_9FIRM|nr:diguanylate cyclase (GGDEF) domain-containing protein [Allisonella histaminiformans]
MGPVSIITGMVTGVNHLDYRKQKGSSAAVRKKQQYLLVSVVFSFLLGIGLLMGAIYGSRAHARHLAELYLSDVTWELGQGIKTTDSLGEILKDSGGKTDSFYTGARALQLQNPVVELFAFELPSGQRLISPAGNYVTPPDLYLKDVPVSGMSGHRNAADTLFFGPSPISDADTGIYIRKSVYAGTEKYVGTVTTILSINKLLRTETISELARQGYDYRLLQVVGGNVRVITTNLDKPLSYPLTVTENYEGQRWELQVMPHNGWMTPEILLLGVTVMAMGGFVLYTAYEWVKLRTRNEELNMETRVLRKESVIDPLTQIYNRRGFEIEANHLLRSQDKAILVFLDINDYKVYNDIYGHEAGDRALVSLARELTALMKKMHGLTGRMGGDEFAMLIPGNSQKHIELLSKWADKKHFFVQKGTSFEFAVSVGYAFYPDHGVGLMDLLHKADKAAYHIKRVKGINSFCYNSVLEKEHRLNMGFSVKDLEYGMPAALVICEANYQGRILFANREAEQLYGYENNSSSWMGKRWADMIAPEELPRVLMEIKGYRNRHGAKDMNGNYPGPRKPINFHLIKADGSRRKVSTLGRIAYNQHYGDIMFILMFE